MDATTPEGIARAKQLQLIQSGVADIIFSPLLYQTTQLFEGTGKQARLFAVFRHPVERAISLFHYLKKVGIYDASLDFVMIRFSFLST